MLGLFSLASKQFNLNKYIHLNYVLYGLVYLFSVPILFTRSGAPGQQSQHQFCQSSSSV